jgi:hypothetical protein
MIDNIHNNQVAHMMGKGPLPHTDAPNKRLSDESDATIQVNFGEVIDQARQSAKADADAVGKARELLRSGRLTSPENIRSAAEGILTLGI